MSDHLIEQINHIYKCSNKISINVHSIPSVNFQTFHRNISLLLKLLGSDSVDDYWSPIISSLKRFRFDVSAAPLSKSILSEKAKILSASLNIEAKRCEQVYGKEYSNMLNLLASQAKLISANIETNLLDFLANFAVSNGSANSAIAISASRLIPFVQESVKSFPELAKCEIVCGSNLREPKCYSRIYVIGAPRWFDDFIFSSPRSNEIHIIKHKWISGSWQPKTSLSATYKHHSSNSSFPEIVDDSSDVIEDKPEELIPRIDMKHILDKALYQSIELMGDDDDVVVAKLILLENDWAVFLDSNDNSGVDIIDFEEDIKKRVRRVSIRELQAGIFILLRTEGGGDYIVPVADQIMGNFKEKARADQKKWKTLLREHVKEAGITKTITDLRNLGSKIVSPMNLRNWMSFRGIRTESYDDFLAIMALVGLKNEAKKYWETMSIIRNAHTKAGFTIRSMLLEQVTKSDLETLKHQGRMDFELSVQGAGSLSAFRVVDISKDTVEVIHWKIGEPFQVTFEKVL
jgi:hypothetical protein